MNWGKEMRVGKLAGKSQEIRKTVGHAVYLIVNIPELHCRWLKNCHLTDCIFLGKCRADSHDQKNTNCTRGSPAFLGVGVKIGQPRPCWAQMLERQHNYSKLCLKSVNFSHALGPDWIVAGVGLGLELVVTLDLHTDIHAL